jgi:hypothetical protein
MGHLTSTGMSDELKRSDDRMLHLVSPFNSLPLGLERLKIPPGPGTGRDSVYCALWERRERENPSRLLIDQALAPSVTVAAASQGLSLRRS